MLKPTLRLLHRFLQGRKVAEARKRLLSHSSGKSDVLQQVIRTRDAEKLAINILEIYKDGYCEQ